MVMAQVGKPLEDVLRPYRDLIEERLRAVPPGCECDASLKDAMTYALEGGKRLRGAILLSFHEALGGKAVDAMGFAASLEMIHAYSLVHDDLPCIDDDDFRRGKPSCHKKFGYAMALLAGDALLTAAFEVAASSPALPPGAVLRGISELSRAAGPSGMVGGQVLDLGMEGETGGPARVRKTYRMKTGSLFQVSAKIGAVLAGAAEHVVKAAGDWGSLFGYAYQVLDDLEDLEQEQEKDTLARETSPEDARREAEDALLVSLRVLGVFGGRANLAETLSQHYLARSRPQRNQ